MLARNSPSPPGTTNKKQPVNIIIQLLSLNIRIQNESVEAQYSINCHTVYPSEYKNIVSHTISTLRPTY